MTKSNLDDKTKYELVQLVNKKLGIIKSNANKLNKEDLLKLLKKCSVKKSKKNVSFNVKKSVKKKVKSVKKKTTKKASRKPKNNSQFN